MIQYILIPLLLCMFATSVHAECAWVMWWTSLDGSGKILGPAWLKVSDFPNYEKCKEGIEKRFLRYHVKSLFGTERRKFQQFIKNIQKWFTGTIEESDKEYRLMLSESEDEPTWNGESSTVTLFKKKNDQEHVVMKHIYKCLLDTVNP